MNKKRLRLRRLIQPGLQLRLTAEFAGLALLGLVLQFILLARRLPMVVKGMETNGEVMDAIPGVLLEMSLHSVVILFPILLAFGIMFTFRIAGPVYRFERYLEGIAKGQESRPCRIRKNDELHSLCEKINEATESLRKQVADEGAGAGAGEATPAPSEDDLRKAG